MTAQLARPHTLHDNRVSTRHNDNLSPLLRGHGLAVTVPESDNRACPKISKYAPAISRPVLALTESPIVSRNVPLSHFGHGKRQQSANPNDLGVSRLAPAIHLALLLPKTRNSEGSTAGAKVKPPKQLSRQWPTTHDCKSLTVFMLQTTEIYG